MKTKTVKQIIYPEWKLTVLGEDLHFKGGTEKDKDNFLENFTRLIKESKELFNHEDISEFTHERNVKIVNEAKDDFEDLEAE